jgi:MFS family permease
VGGALSFFFSGPIAQRFGWRAAMMLAAAPALLLVPLLLALREPQRGAAEKNEALPAGSVRELLAVPTFWWIVISGVLVNFALYAIGTFLPAFLGRIYHMNVGKAGICTGIVYACGGLLGGLLGGNLGNSRLCRAPGGRMLIASVASAVAVPLSYFGIAGSSDLNQSIVLLALSYGLLNMYYGLVYASLQDIVVPALRGTSMAIYFVVMYLGGASWGTVIIGKLSDHFARNAALLAGSAKVTEVFRAVGLQKAMLAIPVLSIALAVVLWAGSKTIGKDILRSRTGLKSAVQESGAAL